MSRAGTSASRRAVLGRCDLEFEALGLPVQTRPPASTSIPRLRRADIRRPRSLRFWGGQPGGDGHRAGRPAPDADARLAPTSDGRPGPGLSGDLPENAQEWLLVITPRTVSSIRGWRGPGRRHIPGVRRTPASGCATPQPLAIRSWPSAMGRARWRERSSWPGWHVGDFAGGRSEERLVRPASRLGEHEPAGAADGDRRLPGRHARQRREHARTPACKFAWRVVAAVLLRDLRADGRSGAGARRRPGSHRASSARSLVRMRGGRSGRGT